VHDRRALGIALALKSSIVFALFSSSFLLDDSLASVAMTVPRE